MTCKFLKSNHKKNLNWKHPKLWRRHEQRTKTSIYSGSPRRFAAKNPFLIQQQEELKKVLMRFIVVEQGNIGTMILPSETTRKHAKDSASELKMGS